MKHKLFFSALFLMLVRLPGAPALFAHGGGTPRLTSEPTGPYLLSVWTAPDPVRAGELHLTVAVADPARDDAPVLAALVQVELRPRAAHAPPLSARADNEEGANKLLYEADLVLPAAGRWDVQVTVDEPAGQGAAQFELDVLAARTGNWPLFGGAGVTLAALLFLAFRRHRRA